ncbi:hypothetical protein [Thalassotalea hakodatensis]|uniref:hypothetical protein n=1 Tax=Thalassotalea hakodatensis TaxID=3030492 RepID=UPI00257289B3|nr:hypothetical protein [Thalassotalea hakodatensis]
MKPSLKKAFWDIEMGRAINWKKFSSQLAKFGIADKEIKRAFKVTRYSDDAYAVAIASEKLVNQFKVIIESHSLKTRSAASNRGNSHLEKVDGALLVANTSGNVVPYNHLFKKDRLVDTPQKTHCLIIENLECFLTFEHTFHFVSNHCDFDMDIKDIEFLWAAGNSITNSLIIPYLKKFNGQVFCLFDIDQGGLSIYSNLIKAGLEIDNTKFLFPYDIKERLENSKRKACTKELNSLSSNYGLSETTNQLITLIRHYKTTIEQESYRYEF